MITFRRCLLLGVMLLCAVPAVAAAMPVNQTPPVVSGKPEVGLNDLVCSSGTWTSTTSHMPNNDLHVARQDWYYADAGGDPTGKALGPNTANYVPVAADVGQRLVCVVTMRDDSDSTTATANSGPTAPVAPAASIRLTEYSGVVSGTIGELINGVKVTVSLIRTSNAGSSPTVATASTTTTTIDGRAGSWTLTLPNHAFGLPGDALHMIYAPGSSGAPVPVNAAYGTGFVGSESEISSDGTTISSRDVGGVCSSLRFLVNGVTHNTTLAAGSVCRATVSPAVTDNARVQAASTAKVTTNTGHVSYVTRVDNVGLLGVTTEGSLGPPTCSADLVFSAVTCNQLNGGTFAVARDGGTPITLHKTSVSNTGTFTGTAVVPGLKGGDTVVLNETSPKATTRGITTLHVGILRVDLSGKTVVSGSCQPYAPLTQGSNKQGAGGLCSLGGKMSATDNGTGELDEFSGGTTLVNVPTLSNLIPASSGSMPSGSFLSFANINGPGTTAQILAATSQTELKIVSHASGSPTFDGIMTKGSDSSGATEKTTVPAQKSGTYSANWVFTDVNHDTNGYQNTFAVEPGDGDRAVKR
jgi:hypothetical protein